MSRCGAGHSVLLFNEGWGIINFPYKNFRGSLDLPVTWYWKKLQKAPSQVPMKLITFSECFSILLGALTPYFCICWKIRAARISAQNIFHTNSIFVQKSGQVCGNSEENFNINNNNNKPKKSSLLKGTHVKILTSTAKMEKRSQKPVVEGFWKQCYTQQLLSIYILHTPPSNYCI